jgi:hypothetical protein
MKEGTAKAEGKQNYFYVLAFLKAVRLCGRKRAMKASSNKVSGFSRYPINIHLKKTTGSILGLPVLL